jgi:hypothetical protein
LYSARKSLVAQDCVVADAVQVKPVSTPKFPANREKNREFFNFELICSSDVIICPMILGTYREIPYSGKQGIFLMEQGILPAKTNIYAG